MNEPKKIPSAMLETAAEAVKRSATEDANLLGLDDDDFLSFARAALDAAGVPDLATERDSLAVRVIELECDLDNERRRCAVLTGDLLKRLARITELEAANAKLKTRLGNELGWVNN